MSIRIRVEFIKFNQGFTEFLSMKKNNQENVVILGLNRVTSKNNLAGISRIKLLYSLQNFDNSSAMS